MGRFLTTRRSQWAPGIAVLGAAIGIAAAVGLSLSIRNWAVYAGLSIAILLLAGWAGRRIEKRRDPPPAHAQSPSELTFIEGGTPPFDLEADASTDDQKYLM